MSGMKMSYNKVWNIQNNGSEWPRGGNAVAEGITNGYGTLPFSESPLPVTPLMPEGLRLMLAIFLFVVFIVGMTGNLTVIWVFTR